VPPTSGMAGHHGFPPMMAPPVGQPPQAPAPGGAVASDASPDATQESELDALLAAPTSKQLQVLSSSSSSSSAASFRAPVYEGQARAPRLQSRPTEPGSVYNHPEASPPTDPRVAAHQHVQSRPDRPQDPRKRPLPAPVAPAAAAPPAPAPAANSVAEMFADIAAVAQDDPYMLPPSVTMMSDADTGDDDLAAAASAATAAAAASGRPTDPRSRPVPEKARAQTDNEFSLSAYEAMLLSADSSGAASEPTGKRRRL